MTTFAASTVPAMRVALKAGLDARVALETVVISDGPATAGDVVLGERIELMDVEGEQTIETMGGSTQIRWEDMELTVVVAVALAGPAQQTNADKRAFELLDELDQLLRNDTTLAANYGGPGVIDRIYRTSMKQRPRMTPDMSVRQCELEVGIRWQAHI